MNRAARLFVAVFVAAGTDVYPGTRRDLLRRYRLDNPVWTK
jgi:hypothetical protein